MLYLRVFQTHDRKLPARRVAVELNGFQPHKRREIHGKQRPPELQNREPILDGEVQNLDGV